MHTLFRENLVAHMNGVISKFEATKGIEHRYQKGFAREALVQTAIEPWFGPSIAIGSGFVITSAASRDDDTGKTSPECDNVIYWPDMMQRLVLGGEYGPCLFPVEGVAAVVEVKSMLTTAELRSSLSKLKSATRPNVFSVYMHDQFDVGKVLFPLSCVLAFDSNIAKETFQTMLKDHIQSWDAVCVLGGKSIGVYFRDRKGEFVEPQFGDNPSPACLLADFSVQSTHLKKISCCQMAKGLMR